MGVVKAQSAVRAIEQVVAREEPTPVRRASKPRLLDLHRTAGNAAVAALVRGADAPAQAVLLGFGPFELGDALAATFGENVREVPIEAESAVARRAEGLTVNGRVQLGPGRFDATSYEGQVRIGHEVAHALQQARGVNPTGGRLPVTQTRRATLEAEAERAGHAFAGGRPFAVSGVAPAGTALFRGAEGQEPEPEAERELDAAIAELDAKWAARGAALAAARKQRQDWLRAHAEWREFEVPVDERLRKTPASLQAHELDMRLLETALGSISRDDAEFVLRRLAWTSRSVEQASVQEQIRTQTKIHYRTRDISLAVEYYNQLIEDRQRRWAYVDELLHTGPDMALEMFKDVGRGVYNGTVGFAQGVADLPLAPLNLVRTIQGKDPVHTIDLGDLRAGYHTSYGVHQGSSIELGTLFALMVITGKLPGGWTAGSGAAATQTSRAASLFSAWWKVNALAAGGTAVVQAGQGIRDIVRGYVVENGKQRPLTEDDILQRLGGIAFGAHIGYHAIGGLAAQPSTTAGAEPPVPAASPDLLIDRPTASSIRVRSPGESGTLVIDDGGWRVVADDGRVLAQGPPDEARLLASRLTGSDVPAVEPGAAPTPSSPLASPPAGLLEPPKAPDVAGRTTDVSPLELPGEEVIIEGRAPERPTTPRPEPTAPEAAPQDRQESVPPGPAAAEPKPAESPAAQPAPPAERALGAEKPPETTTPPEAAKAAEGDAALPPGVRSSKLRRSGMDLVNKLPKSDRERISRALREMPPAEAGRVLTEIGRLDGVSALEEALAARREAAGAESPAEGPAQPTGGLDDSAPAYLDEDGEWQQFEKRPPPRVSDTIEGVNRSALKGRMTRDGLAPTWAQDAGDWNPHHLIPVSLENHPVLETLRANGGWDNNASANGIALPTSPGIPGAEGLPVHQVTPEVYRQSGTPVPDRQTMRDLQGHPVWNQKVRDRLDALRPLMNRPAELRIAVEKLIDELRHDIATSVANGKAVLF
jgi:Domain of unknown function (DUF4157)/A nuclease family of the HNH/ENDO VII superfamily with conserved AHH